MCIRPPPCWPACRRPEPDIEAHLDGLIAAGKDLLGEEWHYIHQHALSEQLADSREDLEEYGVHFDCWFSERSLFDTGMVAKAVAELEKRGHIYVQDGAKWFRSTDFGDEKDRVVQRENGLYTYFASDIAYHCQQVRARLRQGRRRLGRRPPRLHPARQGRAAGAGPAGRALDVTLVQFVSLFRGSEKVSMSTRAGSYVTLRELARRGRQRCLPLLLHAAQAGPGARFRPRSGQVAIQRQPGLLRPVRPCPRLLRAAAVGRRGGLARRADLAPLASERELALCGGSPISPR